MPTHGSLTKAGKVRAQTPNVESTSSTVNHIPRVRNRINYIRRVIHAPERSWRRRRRR